VTAANLLGDGPTSVLSSASIAYVQTVPHKPDVEMTVDAANTNRE
jgi:hypothetical protein